MGSVSNRTLDNMRFTQVSDAPSLPERVVQPTSVAPAARPAPETTASSSPPAAAPAPTATPVTSAPVQSASATGTAKKRPAQNRSATTLSGSTNLLGD